MGKLKNFFHHKKKKSADIEAPVVAGGAPSRAGEQAAPSSAVTPSSHRAALVHFQDDHEPLLSLGDETFTDDSEPTTPRSRLAKLLRLDAYRFGGALLLLALLLFLASMLYIALEPHFFRDTKFSLEHLGISKPTDDSFMLHADMKLQIVRNPFDLAIDKVTAEVWHKGKVAGVLSLPGIDISGSEQNELSMRTPFQITDGTAFEALLVSAIKKDARSVKVKALVNVQSKRFPSLRYQLPLELPVDVPSSDRLPFKLSILAADLKETEDGLMVLVDVGIESSSPLAITLPVVKFNVLHGGVRVGRIVSDEELAVKRGSSSASLTGYISNPADDPRVAESIESIVSAFMQGEPTTVLLEGDSSGLDMPAKWMRSALDAVRFPFEIAASTAAQKKAEARKVVSADISGKDTVNQLHSSLSVTIPDAALAGKPLPLLHAISLVSTAKNIWPQAYVTVSNPFSVPIRITSIRNLRVEHDSTYLTTINEDPIDPPFVIPPKQISTPDRAFAASYKGDLKSGLALLPELLKHKHVPVGLRGIVGVKIGDAFEIELPYEQAGVPLSYSLNLR